MMKSKVLVLAMPGQKKLAQKFMELNNYEAGEYEWRRFPDGESYTRVISDVNGKEIIIIADLHEPDDKLLPIYFLAKNLRESGCVSINLIAPYLPYMRQDKQFHPGEGITSLYFAELLSGFIDSLITVDPHLHRWNNLSEIYSVKTAVTHAARNIASWVEKEIANPLIIGPDSESKQWVSQVAEQAKAPYLVLNKVRYGDRKVEIHVPDIETYAGCTPVILDDIISTATTMSSVVKQLIADGLPAPVCIGVHAVFAAGAHKLLLDAGARAVVTCNTIEHETNRIDISDILSEGIQSVTS